MSWLQVRQGRICDQGTGAESFALARSETFRRRQFYCRRGKKRPDGNHSDGMNQVAPKAHTRNGSAVERFMENLRAVPRRLNETMFRTGKATSDRNMVSFKRRGTALRFSMKRST